MLARGTYTNVRTAARFLVQHTAGTAVASAPPAITNSMRRTPWSDAIATGHPPYAVCAGKLCCGRRKKCFLCKAEDCIEFWDDIIDTYSAFETLSWLRERNGAWRADCGDDPETFFCEMTHVQKNGRHANACRRAATYGMMPIQTSIVAELAGNGLLNQCAAVKMWFCSEKQMLCSMAFEDLGTRRYVKWFTQCGYDRERVDGSMLDDNGVAEIVETALAMQVATMHGRDFSRMGCTLCFADWLVSSIEESE